MQPISGQVSQDRCRRTGVARQVSQDRCLRTGVSGSRCLRTGARVSLSVVLGVRGGHGSLFVCVEPETILIPLARWAVRVLAALVATGTDRGVCWPCTDAM